MSMLAADRATHWPKQSVADLFTHSLCQLYEVICVTYGNCLATLELSNPIKIVPAPEAAAQAADRKEQGHCKRARNEAARAAAANIISVALLRVWTSEGVQ